MWKAAIVVVLLGGAAFCFWRAYLIQQAHSVDGVIKRHWAYGRMRLWLTAGMGFLVFGLFILAGAFDPGFMPMNGKR